jgi:hypothetical protein
MSYLANASIDQLATAHRAAFAVMLAALIGVVLGAASQREFFSRAMQRRGWILLVVCLAAEPLSMALAFSINEEIHLRREAALLTSRQQEVSRTLSRVERERLSASLAMFGGQVVETIEFPVSLENDRIANEIQALLNNALWFASPVSRLSTPPKGPLIQGILVSATADDQSQAAAGFLVGILRDTISATNFDPSPLLDPDQPRVRVYVGDKPVPRRQAVPTRLTD